MRSLFLAALFFALAGGACHAATISYTVVTSDPVVVDTSAGVPRIKLTFEDQTRYATYVAAASTATSLVFSYAVQPGDFAPAGVQVTPTVDTNGGTIRDLAGNALVSAFTLAPGPTFKIQTYTVALGSITSATATDATITIDKAPVGARYSYTISSDGGAGTVQNTGTIASSPQTLSGIDVSNLPLGKLTVSLTLSNANGDSGQPQTASITPSFAGILDGIPSLAAAYSVRRLRSAYTGPLLQVRTSGGTLVDVSGTTVAGLISAAALTSLCGSGSCTVSRWYDQSGFGRDGIQATVSNQPVIATSGTPAALNGKPTVGLGGKFLQTSAAANWLNSTPFTVNAVATTSASGTFVGTNAVGTNMGLHIGWRSGSQFTVAQYNNDANFSATLSPAATVQTILKSSPGGSTVFLNGTSIGSSSLPNADLATPGVLNIGIGYNAGASWYTSMSELCIFTSVLSTGQRQALERNQGNLYGISVN